jgi:hypothetical protein
MTSRVGMGLLVTVADGIATVQLDGGDLVIAVVPQSLRALPAGARVVLAPFPCDWVVTAWVKSGCCRCGGER